MSTTNPTPWFKRKRFVIPAAIAAVALAVACGSAPDKPIKAADAKPAATAAKPADPPAPSYDEPTAKDYRVNVKVTRKQCFGSAGCNVTVKTSLTVIGSPNLDPAKTYELIYEILGDEDGPVVDSMEIQGDQYSGAGERHISTSSSATRISARITDISES